MLVSSGWRPGRLLSVPHGQNGLQRRIPPETAGAEVENRLSLGLS